MLDDQRVRIATGILKTQKIKNLWTQHFKPCMVSKKTLQKFLILAQQIRMRWNVNYTVMILKPIATYLFSRYVPLRLPVTSGQFPDKYFWYDFSASHCVIKLVSIKHLNGLLELIYSQLMIPFPLQTLLGEVILRIVPSQKPLYLQPQTNLDQLMSTKIILNLI